MHTKHNLCQVFLKEFIGQTMTNYPVVFRTSDSSFRRFFLTLIAALLLTGCQGSDQMTGTYEIRTTAGEIVTLVLTNEQNKRAELVPHDGTVLAQVKGAVPGVWRYKDNSKNAIQVYAWLSGSVFTQQYEIVRGSDAFSMLDGKGKSAGTIRKLE